METFLFKLEGVFIFTEKKSLSLATNCLIKRNNWVTCFIGLEWYFWQPRLPNLNTSAAEGLPDPTASAEEKLLT